MNRVFEQVTELKNELCRKYLKEDFDNIKVANVDFSEILFADDTLIFAESGSSLEAFL